MKILLLGAAGFIGTNLTIELAKKTEDEITLVDRSKAFFKPIVSMDLKNVHILEADLTVDMDFDSILKDQEVVYHLVSTTVPTTSNQHISQELVSNVIFSANLFEACIRCGVKKVVFVSSGGTVSLTSMVIHNFFMKCIIVIADSNHFTSEGSNHKKRATVHRGNRIIDYNNLIGLVNDMFTERQNDEYPYKELASQEDFDRF